MPKSANRQSKKVVEMCCLVITNGVISATRSPAQVRSGIFVDDQSAPCLIADEVDDAERSQPHKLLPLDAKLPPKAAQEDAVEQRVSEKTVEQCVSEKMVSRPMLIADEEQRRRMQQEEEQKNAEARRRKVQEEQEMVEEAQRRSEQQQQEQEMEARRRKEQQELDLERLQNTTVLALHKSPEAVVDVPLVATSSINNNNKMSKTKTKRRALPLTEFHRAFDQAQEASRSDKGRGTPVRSKVVAFKSRSKKNAPKREQVGHSALCDEKSPPLHVETTTGMARTSDTLVSGTREGHVHGLANSYVNGSVDPHRRIDLHTRTKITPTGMVAEDSGTLNASTVVGDKAGTKTGIIVMRKPCCCDPTVDCVD